MFNDDWSPAFNLPAGKEALWFVDFYKAGPLPSRTAVWDYVIDQARNDPYKSEVLVAFQETALAVFLVPPTPYWIESGNLIFPELQAAILGDMSVDQALEDASAAVDGLIAQTACTDPCDHSSRCLSGSRPLSNHPLSRGGAQPGKPTTRTRLLPWLLLLLPTFLILAAVVLVPLLLSLFPAPPPVS